MRMALGSHPVTRAKVNESIAITSRATCRPRERWRPISDGGYRRGNSKDALWLRFGKILKTEGGCSIREQPLFRRDQKGRN
jgi:hypothetical protein